jgi:hypothetical protein
MQFWAVLRLDIAGGSPAAELADALDSKSIAMLGVPFAVAVSLPNGNKCPPRFCGRLCRRLWTLPVSKESRYAPRKLYRSVGPRPTLDLGPRIMVFALRK